MRILFLSTWFPYPLSIGSKLRAYYLIRALAQENDLALISFSDEIIHSEWIDHMREICQVVEVVPDDPFEYNRLRAWTGRFSLRPTSVRSSYSPKMLARIKELNAEWAPDLIIATTFVTAPYALEITGIPKIVDLENLMAPMLYENYLKTHRFIKRVRHWFAWIKFRKYEKWLYPKFDLSLVTSERDRQAILQYVPVRKSQVGIVPNGVDTSLNTSGLSLSQPNTLIYNGSLTYQANFDAILYFLQEIFPLICDQMPDVKLMVTGKTQDVPFDKLPSHSNVIYTGYLDDIRSAVAASWVCVIPLRKGGGTRLKVLEAMALGTPVVSTSKGVEGLKVESGKHLLIADNPREFANLTLLLLRDSSLRNYLITNANRLVQENYSWDDIGNRLLSLVQNINKFQPVHMQDTINK